jgi:hypothetical protein
MPLSIPEQQLAKRVAELVHKGQPKEAAQYFIEFCKLGIKLTDDNPAKFLPVLQTYLHYLLNNGGLAEAAQILWTPTQFNPNPQSVKEIWDMVETTTTGLLMGAGSMGNRSTSASGCSSSGSETRSGQR